VAPVKYRLLNFEESVFYKSVELNLSVTVEESSPKAVENREVFKDRGSGTDVVFM